MSTSSLSTTITNNNKITNMKYKIVLIVCGSILGACALGVGVFFIIKTVKGKGGKENEENNIEK